MKAAYLGQVIEYFDPMLSLDVRHSDWFVERPDSPHLEMKAVLLNTTADTKTLFSGHQGSGKTSTLNKLAADPEISGKFFVVQFSIKDELNIADLTYTDLLVAMGARLYAVAEKALRLNGKLKKDLDEWSAEVSRVWSKTDQAEVKVEAGISAFFLKARGLLRTGFEDKEEFRKRFEPRIPQLIEIINRIIAAIETHPQAVNQEVLLILDDLDKPAVDVAMDLFFKKGTILAQPQCKIIFTVPTSLLYSGQYNVVKGNFGEPFTLPNFKIKEQNGERNDLAWSRMREIAERRLDMELDCIAGARLCCRDERGSGARAGADYPQRGEPRRSHQCQLDPATARGTCRRQTQDGIQLQPDAPGVHRHSKAGPQNEAPAI